MRSSPRRFRRGVVVLLLLQVTLAAAWAQHVSAGRPDAAHVEEAGTAGCPVLHDDGHCLVCQVMTLRLLGADTVRLRVPQIITGTGSARAAPFRPAPAARTTRHSRAPPLA
jgi:hypothetical protein